MANSVYPKAKERFLTGDLDLTTATLKIALISNSYTYADSHTDFTSEVSNSGANLVGTAQPITTPTVTVVGDRAVFDADSNINFGTIASGSTIQALVIYDDTPVDPNKTPILYIDDGAGLPFSTNGGTIEVDFSTGTNKVFAI